MGSNYNTLQILKVLRNYAIRKATLHLQRHFLVILLHTHILGEEFAE